MASNISTRNVPKATWKSWSVGQDLHTGCTGIAMLTGFRQKIFVQMPLVLLTLKSSRFCLTSITITMLSEVSHTSFPGRGRNLVYNNYCKSVWSPISHFPSGLINPPETHHLVKCKRTALFLTCTFLKPLEIFYPAHPQCRPATLNLPLKAQFFRFKK